MANEGKTQGAATGQAPQLRYVDRAECAETFADSINAISFDGQTMRIEFGVTRMDDVKPNERMTGRRYPACRLVLTPAAAVDLINKMQQTAAALQQAGVVKTGAPSKGPTAP
jgi:hypothetical protein